jgi:hypothetical protein
MNVQLLKRWRTLWRPRELFWKHGRELAKIKTVHMKLKIQMRRRRMRLTIRTALSGHRFPMW